MEYYSAIKKEWTVSTHNNVLNAYAKWKEPVLKDYKLYYSIYMTSGWGKNVETEQISSCQGLGVEVGSPYKGVAWENSLGCWQCVFVTFHKNLSVLKLLELYNKKDEFYSM